MAKKEEGKMRQAHSWKAGTKTVRETDKQPKISEKKHCLHVHKCVHKQQE